ncbi:MAG: UPF0489 family protein, partial [Candidatus Omnitrophica bacterium]|nr:UPF0489 family protein [Candidatus Omnitrophota bacterium]
WRENKVRDLDLIHIDAHIDFDFPRAKLPVQAVTQAKSLKELKNNLEHSLVFRRYEDNFDKQTNMGNYIYPAIQEGIVKNFYWVVPGGLKEFVNSFRVIRNLLRGILDKDSSGLNFSLKISPGVLREGLISTKLLGRKFVICILEKLPVLKQKTLLDIDTDFLVINSLLKADPLKDIGKRQPWIYPKDLIGVLKKKVKHPEIITIAYSGNGGFTAIKYKHLGDEMAYRFLPQYFKARYRRSMQAAEQFYLFKIKKDKGYYQKTNKLDSTYRVGDNNYGPLFLRSGKLTLAKKEFRSILRADSTNVFALSGLGQTYLQKNEFFKARQYFNYALKQKADLVQALSGLAQVEFRLGEFKKAQALFMCYKKLQPLDPKTYFFLGNIYEKQKNFKGAYSCYQDVIRLGSNGIEVIEKILKISRHIKSRYDIISFISGSFNKVKKGLVEKKISSLKSVKDRKGFLKLQNRLMFIETRIKKERSCINGKR